MRQELLSPIRDNQAWLDRFNRNDYVRAYEEYTTTFGDLYGEAVQQAADDAALQALAEELLDALAAAWSKVGLFKRSGVKYNDKQMVLVYLSPMLLDREDPRCGLFAETLCKAWSVRWPKDAYKLATYQKLRSGFRYTIMGFELPARHPED